MHANAVFLLVAPGGGDEGEMGDCGSDDSGVDKALKLEYEGTRESEYTKPLRKGGGE